MKTSITLLELDEMQSECERNLRTIKEFRKLLLARDKPPVVLDPSDREIDNGDDLTAAQKIRNIIFAYGDNKFTVKTIASKLPEVERGRISMTIHQLKNKELVVKIEGGNGNIPAVYKCTNKDNWVDLVTDREGG